MKIEKQEEKPVREFTVVVSCMLHRYVHLMPNCESRRGRPVHERPTRRSSELERERLGQLSTHANFQFQPDRPLLILSCYSHMQYYHVDTSMACFVDKIIILIIINVYIRFRLIKSVINQTYYKSNLIAIF